MIQRRIVFALQLLIVVLPKVNGDDVYRAIKSCCELSTYKRGLVTQCIKYHTIDKLKHESNLAKNLCLKIKPKLGGFNWVTNLTLLPTHQSEQLGIMLLGADVYHPRPTTSTDTEETRFAPSVAAVCIPLHFKLSNAGQNRVLQNIRSRHFSRFRETHPLFQVENVFVIFL